MGGAGKCVPSCLRLARVGVHLCFVRPQPSSTANCRIQQLGQGREPVDVFLGPRMVAESEAKRYSMVDPGRARPHRRDSGRDSEPDNPRPRADLRTTSARFVRRGQRPAGATARHGVALIEHARWLPASARAAPGSAQVRSCFSQLADRGVVSGLVQRARSICLREPFTGLRPRASAIVDHG